jgi:hypothetical protein
VPRESPGGSFRPVRRDGASPVELDDNVALYDDVGRLLVLLNASAAEVWALCDGGSSIDEIAQALADAHPEEADLIGDDVHRTVGKLAELGLVVEPGPDGRHDGEAGA